MRHESWYSVENCGDGSAYPKFMESEALCKVEQEFMDEGWGEPCVGHVVVSSESPITVEGLVTVGEVIKEEEEELAAGYYGPYAIRRVEDKLVALKALREQVERPQGATDV